MLAGRTFGFVPVSLGLGFSLLSGEFTSLCPSFTVTVNLFTSLVSVRTSLSNFGDALAVAVVVVCATTSPVLVLDTAFGALLLGAASFDDGGTWFDDGGFGFGEGIGLNRRVNSHDLGTEEERLFEELIPSQFSRFRHFERSVQKLLSRFHRLAHRRNVHLVIF
jgi:hypothetical protein